MKFKKQALLLTSVLIASLAILVSHYAVSARDIPDNLDVIDSFQYEYGPDHETWAQNSIQTNRTLLRIPEEKLSRLSDDALYEAFISYPFLIDILAYAEMPNDVEKPLEQMKRYFSAYQEILKRDLTITELAVNYQVGKNKELPDDLNVDALTEFVLETVEYFDFNEVGIQYAVEDILQNIVRYELAKNPSLLDKLGA